MVFTEAYCEESMQPECLKSGFNTHDLPEALKYSKWIQIISQKYFSDSEMIPTPIQNILDLLFDLSTAFSIFDHGVLQEHPTRPRLDRHVVSMSLFRSLDQCQHIQWMCGRSPYSCANVYRSTVHIYRLICMIKNNWGSWPEPIKNLYV